MRHNTYALINIEKVVQDDIALGFVETNDPGRERSVYEERLPAGSRVHTNDWVNTLNMLRTGVGIVAVKVGVRRLEVCLLAVDDFAEARTELLVSSVARRPQGVSADRWYDVIVEVCNSRRLTLVNQISMPARSTARVSEVCGSLSCLESRPDHSNAFDAGHLRYLRLRGLRQHMDIYISRQSLTWTSIFP